MDDYIPRYIAKAQVVHEIQTVFLPWLLRVLLECYIRPVDIDLAARNSILMNYPRLSKEQKMDLKTAVDSDSYEHMDVTLLAKLIR